MFKFTIYSTINRNPLNTFKDIKALILAGEIRDFNEIALQIFHIQAIHNPVYRDFIGYLGLNPTNITQIEDVPFMPVEFFKEHRVVTGEWTEDVCYTSSGTTGTVTSRHHVRDREFYLQHAKQIFESVYGPITDFHILALLPGYLERSGSSLIDMVRYFIQESGDSHSGFYLHEHQQIREKIAWLEKNSPRKILLIGVSFALLDMAEHGNFPISEKLIVMETGGMKGRRREMLREELHAFLCSSFHVDRIHSEYGMTEALSQSYSTGAGLFDPSFTMRFRLRDPNDPLDLSDSVSRGGINLIDLANMDSCSFLQLQDLGERTSSGQIRILGRMDNSDIRGCNLMVQQPF